MRVVWGSGKGFDVEVDGLSLPAAVARALARPEAKAAIAAGALAARKRVAGKSRLGGDDAARLAAAFLEGGRRAVSDELGRMGRGAAGELAEDELRRSFRTPDSFLSGLRDSLDRDRDEDFVEIVAIVRQQALAALSVAIEEAVHVAIPAGDGVEFKKGLSSEPLSFSGNARSVATVEPDAALAALFEAGNVAIEDFAREVAQRYGVALLAGDDGSLDGFLSAHSFGFSNHGARSVARAWRDFAPNHDGSAPAALSAGDLLLMLEGAKSVAMPTCVTSVPLRAAVEAGEGGWQGAGETLLGVVDPGDLTGYLVKVRAPPRTPAGSERWRLVSDLDEGQDDEMAFSLPMR